MTIDDIKELVALLEQSSLVEMDIQDGDFKIRLSRKGEVVQALPSHLPTLPSTPVETADDTADNDEDLITSPLVGTFYSAAGPDIPAFVRVGDKLKAGDTVCILEAMKLMNEITVDADCVVEAILVSNEQKVEYGQPLFRIRKI
ncbi:acetyl-CoA carboxylase biotin carboxyl carrier protein [Streptococcus moroccensis]|uniref:Biotin carboxyl carrier protein of acetyl-CoA carboxylase n=1 Tax=Streptococcus moroccensis TaxID=1451356 RepID=A0ABT9YTY7_9STRE|nr:acetyl-CoA carboxylase biotin carboxyl carrier protein [Streptococcus moroccensis]MDQ0223452.1 acetyl-CoA carboxylase biotin carboxyl carrier protein [Streptococcus moroccensis]